MFVGHANQFVNIIPPHFISNTFGKIPYPWIFNLNLFCQIECVLFVNCYCVVGIVTQFYLQSKALSFSFLIAI